MTATTLNALTVRVLGHEPAPQGSMNALIVRGRAIVVPDNAPKLKTWRRHVSEAAKSAALAAGWYPFDGPTEVVVHVYLPRPKSTPARILWPFRKPDVDKLARAILDALSPDAIVDDARIVHLDVWKHYADERPVGATIRVRPLVGGLL